MRVLWGSPEQPDALGAPLATRVKSTLPGKAAGVAGLTPVAPTENHRNHAETFSRRRCRRWFSALPGRVQPNGAGVGFTGRVRTPAPGEGAVVPLIPCPACQKQVSVHALECVACGHPIAPAPPRARALPTARSAIPAMANPVSRESRRPARRRPRRMGPTASGPLPRRSQRLLASKISGLLVLVILLVGGLVWVLASRRDPRPSPRGSGLESTSTGVPADRHATASTLRTAATHIRRTIESENGALVEWNRRYFDGEQQGPRPIGLIDLFQLEPHPDPNAPLDIWDAQAARASEALRRLALVPELAGAEREAGRVTGSLRAGSRARNTLTRFRRVREAFHRWHELAGVGGARPGGRDSDVVWDMHSREYRRAAEALARAWEDLAEALDSLALSVQ